MPGIPSPAAFSSSSSSSKNSTPPTAGSSPPSSPPPHSRIPSTSPPSMSTSPASPTWSTAATAGCSCSSPSPPPSRLRHRISSLNLGSFLSPLPFSSAPTLTRQRKHLRGKPKESSWLELFGAAFRPSEAWVRYLAEEEAQFAAWEALVNGGKGAGGSLYEEGEGKESVIENGDDDLVGPCVTDKAIESSQTAFRGGNAVGKEDSGGEIRLGDVEVLGDEKEEEVVVGVKEEEEDKPHARWDLSPSPRTPGPSRSEDLRGAEISLGDGKEDFDSRRSIEALLVENRSVVRRTWRIGAVGE